jgi:GNAT superfamily N-acetyltransferase
MIRTATREDLATLVELWIACDMEEMGEEFYGTEKHYPQVDWVNYKALTQDLQFAIDAPDRAVYVAIGADNKPIGFIRGTASVRPTTAPAYYVYVNCMYVKPEYRKTPAAAELHDILLEWVKTVNATYDGCHIATAEIMARPGKGRKRWERKGWKTYGIMMRKELEL